MNKLVKPAPQDLEQRRVEMETGWNLPEALQNYDPYAGNQMYVPPQQYIVVNTPQPEQQSALSPMNFMARSMQNMIQMQMTMMREIDQRLNRLEQARPQAQPNPERFYTQTWWALWGILMLILGSALVLVLVMILRG